MQLVIQKFENSCIRCMLARGTLRGKELAFTSLLSTWTLRTRSVLYRAELLLCRMLGVKKHYCLSSVKGYAFFPQFTVELALQMGQ
ncbi:hypothetical protein FKM82_024503 [Ascaphus truei]